MSGYSPQLVAAIRDLQAATRGARDGALLVALRRWLPVLVLEMSSGQDDAERVANVRAEAERLRAPMPVRAHG